MSAATFETKMSFLAKLVSDPKLSASAKVVAVPLLVTFHNNETGRCNPSYATLAEATGRCRRAVIDAVTELREAGWISIESTSGGNSKCTNKFSFAFDRVDSGVKDTAPVDADLGVKPAARVKSASPVKNNVGRGEAHRTRTSKEPLILNLTIKEEATPGGDGIQRKAKRAKARTKVDPNSQPTEQDVAAAIKRGMPEDVIPTEWTRHLDWHESKGSEMADWHAAWRTWCGGWRPRPASHQSSNPRNRLTAAQEMALAGGWKGPSHE